MTKTKMLINEAITWWFRQAEKLPDGSAKIFEVDNNRLAKEIAKLEAKLAAHLKNEGDECPLCKLEADNAALEAETEALGILLSNLVDVELERDELQQQVEGLETEVYRQMQGRRLLGERLAATGHLLLDFNDAYKKTKDKYADLQKTLNEMDNSGLLKEYRNWKAVRKAEEGK